MCLYFQSLSTFELREDVQTISFLASVICEYNDKNQLNQNLFSLPFNEFGEVLTKLITAYRLCMAIEKKQIYKTIFYLNDHSFGNIDTILDAPLGDINIMVEILNEHNQNSNPNEFRF
jgi:hypothetical protein